MKHLLIGFGIAGQILLLELLKKGISASEIIIVDPNFIGGALVTNYPNLLSNTPWWKTRKTLEAYPTGITGIEFGDAKYKHDDLMPVRDIAKCLLLSCRDLLKTVEVVNDLVISINESNCVNLRSGRTINGDVIYLCQGSCPKIMDVGLPIIPLDVALDPDRLRLLIDKNDRVVVFGCSHSGVLAMKNLIDVGANVIGIYRGAVRVKFERDGAYDGIKGHAVPIADAMLNGELPVEFVNWNETIAVAKALKKADKVVFACGFEMNRIIGGENYDADTGVVNGMDGLRYGFGIAYPGVSVIEGRTYEDVSVLSFQEQIQRCLKINQI